MFWPHQRDSVGECWSFQTSSVAFHHSWCKNGNNIYSTWFTLKLKYKHLLNNLRLGNLLMLLATLHNSRAPNKWLPCLICTCRRNEAVNTTTWFHIKQFSCGWGCWYLPWLSHSCARSWDSDSSQLVSWSSAESTLQEQIKVTWSL